MDWVKVYEAHNRYEWRMQQALEAVEPWGEDRADMRAAVNTAALMTAQAAEKPSEYEIGCQINGLRGYLKIHRPDED